MRYKNDNTSIFLTVSLWELKECIQCIQNICNNACPWRNTILMVIVFVLDAPEVENCLQKVYWRVHSGYTPVRKWGRWDWADREADPQSRCNWDLRWPYRELSGARIALWQSQTNPGGWVADPCISQLLTAGSVMEGCVVKTGPFVEGSLWMTAVRSHSCDSLHLSSEEGRWVEHNVSTTNSTTRFNSKTRNLISDIRKQCLLRNYKWGTSRYLK